RSTPRLSIDMPLHLPPLERERARLGDAEQLAVHLREHAPQPSLGGHAEDDDAGALLGRKLPIVEIVAVERHQRAPELAREAVVLDVAGASQVLALERREHVTSPRL